MGASVVNALSDWLEVEICQEDLYLSLPQSYHRNQQEPHLPNCQLFHIPNGEDLSMKYSLYTTPVLLLDDVLSELDSSRQNYLLNSIGDVQTHI